MAENIQTIIPIAIIWNVPTPFWKGNVDVFIFNFVYVEIQAQILLQEFAWGPLKVAALLCRCSTSPGNKSSTHDFRHHLDASPSKNKEEEVAQIYLRWNDTTNFQLNITLMPIIAVHSNLIS